VIAVLESMPAIDGHQPTFSMGEDECCPSAAYSESEEGEFGVAIQAWPDDEPLESFAPDMREADGWIIEGHAIDPDGDLIWMALGPSPEDKFEVFVVSWAEPDGSWVFFAVADTAESRVKLVDAFVTAAGG
jgi:hypothetical protein